MEVVIYGGRPGRHIGPEHILLTVRSADHSGFFCGVISRISTSGHGPIGTVRRILLPRYRKN